MIYGDQPYAFPNVGPEVAAQAKLARHDGFEPVFLRKGNPFTLIQAQGQTIPVYSIHTENRMRPVEHALLSDLRETFVPVDTMPETGGPNDTDRFQMSGMNALVNTSLSALSGFVKKGRSLIYG